MIISFENLLQGLPTASFQGNMMINTEKVTQHGVKYGKFLFAGLPSFLVAVPLNFLLVEWGGIPKPVAYALVLCFQVLVNFFMCCLFVFSRNKEKSFFSQFVRFVSGILFLRVVDWAFYFLLVECLQFYYLTAQITNVLLFSILKYFFAKQVVEG